MSPEQYAAVGTEHAHQVAVFIWASKHLKDYPELKWLYAIPNGGERNPAVAARLKAEGVKSGVSDLCLPAVQQGVGSGHCGLYIEMKKPGGKESKEQIEFGAFVKEQGYFYSCCKSWEEARNVLIWYLDMPVTT